MTRKRFDEILLEEGVESWRLDEIWQSKPTSEISEKALRAAAKGFNNAVRERKAFKSLLNRKIAENFNQPKITNPN